MLRASLAACWAVVQTITLTHYEERRLPILALFTAEGASPHRVAIGDKNCSVFVARSYEKVVVVRFQSREGRSTPKSVCCIR